jgi:hypothetical protein
MIATLEYQHTKATAVTITARYPIAAQWSVRRRTAACAPSTNMPSASSMALAIQTVCSETPQAPCPRDTGIAKSVKAASQSNATIAQPNAAGIDAAGASNDHAANRDHNGGQDNLLGWPLPIEQGTEEADQDRNAGDCDRHRRPLCM